MAHSNDCSGGGCCGHAVTNLDDLGTQYSLYTRIDLDRVECLNEAQENSGRTVFKPWEQRLDRQQFVISDADEELLFNIPFTGNIKLKGIIVIGGEEESHPSKLRIFKNRPHLTFDDVRGDADQEFELARDHEGVIEYATKVVSFSSVHHLTLHFPSNFGGVDETKVLYIGLRGEFFEAPRTGVVNAVYEARPMMKDHKQDTKDLGTLSGNPQF